MASLNIILAILLWSSLGVVVRLSAAPVHLLIFYSCAVSVLFMSIFLFRKDFRKEIAGRRLLKFPVILGVLGLINTFTYFYSFQNTSIANAVLTHYTAPIIVAFLAPVILRETITFKIVAAIALASGGLLLMLNGFSPGNSDSAGLFAGLASGFAYAFIIILGRIYTQGIHPLVLTFFQNLTITLILLPFVKGFPVQAVWSLLFMGLVHSTIAPILYFRGLRYVAANRAAVLGYLEPFGAIMLSMIMLHEFPPGMTIAGGALIILSGYLTLTVRLPDGFGSRG